MALALTLDGCPAGGREARCGAPCEVVARFWLVSEERVAVQCLAGHGSMLLVLWSERTGEATGEQRLR